MSIMHSASARPLDRADRLERDATLRDSLLRDSLLIVGVEGLHSHKCEETIVSALNAVAGVREAEVDFASGQSSIIFDARKVTAHQLLEVIAAAGYRCGHYALGNGGGRIE